MAPILVSIHNSIGKGLSIRDIELTPVANTIRTSPRFPARLVWTRPVQVRVRAGSGEVRTLGITDRTRIVQLAILVAGFLIVLLMRFFSLTPEQPRGSKDL